MSGQRYMFDRAGLRELDRRAVEEYHIPILVLMENAGRGVADAARRRLARSGRVLVLAGPGNNGGDGLVAARHLHNAGHDVTVLLLARRDAYRDAAAAQLAIVDAMKLAVRPLSANHAELRDWIVESSPEDLLIDAIFGTGLSRPVDGLAADVIAGANDSRRAILAVDTPSGLDCDTGVPLGGSGSPAIRAVETVSFCGDKKGFVHAGAYVGRLTILDIGAPRELLSALSIPAAGPL